MSRTNRWILIVSAFLFIVLLGYGLFRFLLAQKEDPARQSAPEIVREVKAVEVTYGTVQTSVSGTGRILSVNETDLIAEIGGKIYTGTVPIKKGAVFHAGDRLYSIYTEEARLALLARKSRFISTVASVLPDLSIDYPGYASAFREFFLSLDEEKPFPPIPETGDEKLKIFLASRELTPEYYGILKDELQLSRHSYTAAFNGTFTEVFLEAGSYAGTGSRIAHIIRTDELEAEVPLDRKDAAWVKPGDPARVYSDRFREPVKGVVTRKSLFVDENTQSQSVFILIRNPESSPLLLGEYIQAEFTSRPVDNALVVPRNAVINGDEFFVVVNGRLEKRKANIIKTNEATAIINGIDEGEWLVVQPLINVLEGTMVKITGQGKNEAPVREKEPKP